MPITKSAKKALRQSARRHTRNLAKKRTYKSAVKGYKKLVAAGDTEKTHTALSRAYKALDKAAKADVIKKNKASRLKSRLAKLLSVKSR